MSTNFYESPPVYPSLKETGLDKELFLCDDTFPFLKVNGCGTLRLIPIYFDCKIKVMSCSFIHI